MPNSLTANPLLSLGIALGATAIAALPAMAETTLPSYPTFATLPDILTLQPIPDPTNPDSSVYPDLPIGGSTPTRAAFGAEPFGVSPLDGGISALGTSVVTGYAYSVTGGPKFRAVRVNQSALPYPATQLTLELPGFANQTLVLGTTFNLLNVNPAGFSNFSITGIDPAAGILPTDPPLLTGLLLTGSGTATIIQTPIVTQIATVPEPSNLLGLGLLGFGALLQRQLNKQKQAKKDPQEK